MTDDEAAQLTELAHSLLITRLEVFNSVLSNPHKTVLHTTVEALTQMAQGKLQGRWAFGLAAGLGKSTSVVCWIAALLHLGFEDRISSYGLVRIEGQPYDQLNTFTERAGANSTDHLGAWRLAFEAGSYI